MGEKLFSVPWRLWRRDIANKHFVLDVDQDRLSSAPGFDKDDWPDMQDPTWGGIYLLIMELSQSEISDYD
ncbi:hypothetical protein [Pseudomonas sp. PDM19]|uniref:hypothetical protein n=1 Tax=Pseudomonas sp. PDM19 TaxID=2769272 RepID=UPI001CE11A8E|nr:hypothetical protein [Pseudomonas sp. PDM19]